MEKDFDFDDIGKRTPYRTPEGFFEENQRKIMEHAFGARRKKRRLKMVIAGVMVAAAMVAGILFVPFDRSGDAADASLSDRLAVETTGAYNSDPMDKWINELSDEDLEEWVSLSENDIFLN